MSMKYLNWMYKNIPYKFLYPGEQSVLAALAVRYNDSPDRPRDKPNCYPSMKTLMRMTQLSESGVQKCKIALRELGFLRWTPGGRAGVKRGACEYELLYPPVKGTTRPTLPSDAPKKAATPKKVQAPKPKPATRSPEMRLPKDEQQSLETIQNIKSQFKDTGVGFAIGNAEDFLKRYNLPPSRMLPSLLFIAKNSTGVGLSDCADAVGRVIMEADVTHIHRPDAYLLTALQEAVQGSVAKGYYDAEE